MTTLPSQGEAGSSSVSHEAIQASLYLYAECLVNGRNVQEEYPEISAHLPGCERCRAALVSLLALVAPLYQGEPSVGIAPDVRPNLAFLQRVPHPAPPAPRFWSVDELGRLFIRFSEALLPSLRPVAVREGESQGLLYRYSYLPDAPHHLHVRVDIVAVSGGATEVQVQIQVDDPTYPEVEQGGVLVRLTADGELLGAGHTHKLGQILFPPIPHARLAALEIEIVPRDRTAGESLQA